MNASELRIRLIQYVEEKTSDKFPISDNFLLVCLDEAIELALNTTINGVKANEYYGEEEFITQTLLSWKSNVKSFLVQSSSNSNITFRGVPVPPAEDHQELLSQVYQLAFQCGFE